MTESHNKNPFHDPSGHKLVGGMAVLMQMAATNPMHSMRPHEWKNIPEWVVGGFTTATEATNNIFELLRSIIHAIDKKEATYLEKFRIMEKDATLQHENMVKM